MQKTVRDGVYKALRYIYPPNKLRLCGLPRTLDNYVLMLRDIEKAIEFLNSIPHFSKYCTLIAKHHGIEKYSPDVVAAYFLGSSLAVINGVSHTHFALKLMSEGEILKSTKSAEYAATLLDRFNNCAVRYGQVIFGSNTTIIAKMVWFQMKENMLVGQLRDEALTMLPFERESYVKGDLITVHWGFVVEKIDEESYAAMRESIKRDIIAFNNR